MRWLRLRWLRLAVIFWGLCIPLRTYLATRGNDPLLHTAAAVMSFRWLTGKETQRVCAFGGPAFWAKERPLHGALWGGYAATGNPGFLWADTVFGAANWLSFHTFASPAAGVLSMPHSFVPRTIRKKPFSPHEGPQEFAIVQ